ncbi:MAG: beta-lactam-binding protein with PASTA domain [Flavobacteriales bacterium]|jgi:beta-lactam-binding protein with PASTA domain
MKLLKFIVSKTFGKNLILAIFFVLIAVFSTWFGLKWYTGHDDFVLVPDVLELSIDDADVKFAESDLQYLIIDSVWSVQGIGGTILRQEPEAEVKVKAGRSVYLTVHRYAPEAVKLNIQEGLNFKIAMIKLHNKGIAIDTVFQPNVLLHDRVIKVTQNGKRLAEDALVKPGDKVTLVVGRRGNEKVRVPSLHGLTLDSAQKVLTEANLSLGQPFYTADVTSRMDSSLARVYMQEPKAAGENTMTIGGNVDVFLNMKRVVPKESDSLNLNYEKGN